MGDLRSVYILDVSLLCHDTGLSTCVGSSPLIQCILFPISYFEGRSALSTTRAGRWLLVQRDPLRTADHQALGIVLTSLLAVVDSAVISSISLLAHAHSSAVFTKGPTMDFTGEKNYQDVKHFGKALEALL